MNLTINILSQERGNKKKKNSKLKEVGIPVEHDMGRAFSCFERRQLPAS
jgi:hypothetical protein